MSNSDLSTPRPLLRKYLLNLKSQNLVIDSPLTQRVEPSPTSSSVTKHPKLNYSSSYQSEYTKQRTISQHPPITIKEIKKLCHQPYLKSTSVVSESTNSTTYKGGQTETQVNPARDVYYRRNLPMICPKTTYQTQFYDMGKGAKRELQSPAHQTHIVNLPIDGKTTYNTTYSPQQMVKTLQSERQSRIKRLGPLDFMLSKPKESAPVPFDRDTAFKRQDQLFSSKTPAYPGQFLTEKNKSYQGRFKPQEKLKPAESTIKIFYYTRD